MFSLENHIAAVIVMCYIAFATWVAVKLQNVYQQYNRARRNRHLAKMAGVLKKYGTLWVLNEKNGVCAVCTSIEFDSAVICWKETVRKDMKAFTVNPVILASNIFTFHKERMPYLTGTSDDLWKTLEDLIFDLLGRKYSRQLVRKYIKDLGRIITREDNRLYVPFTGSFDDLKWEEYKYTTLDLSRRRLHKEVINMLAL